MSELSNKRAALEGGPTRILQVSRNRPDPSEPER